jgi:NDP-sugar pyrophosphorylase family protein
MVKRDDDVAARVASDAGDETPDTSPMDNPVVIMAGGPKPMVEVGGRPILEIIVERFVRQGFTRLYLAVNDSRKMIEGYFGDGMRWGAQITYIQEAGARGTVVPLARLPKTERKPVIVMNGDLVTRVNFRQLVAFHDLNGGPATMAVSEARFAVPYGVVTADDGLVTTLEEKPVKSFSVNAGIYVIAPDVVDMINTPALGMHALNMNELFSMLLSQAKNGFAPCVFPLREYWIDVGHVGDLDQAQRDMRNLIKEV